LVLSVASQADESTQNVRTEPCTRYHNRIKLTAAGTSDNQNRHPALATPPRVYLLNAGSTHPWAIHNSHKQTGAPQASHQRI
jgi:hypothetical protein